MEKKHASQYANFGSLPNEYNVLKNLFDMESLLQKTYLYD